MPRHQVQVRFRDLDVLGHVNSAVFFTYMEAARVDFAGLVFDPEPSYQVPFVVGASRCEYRIPIEELDPLDVAYWVSQLGESSWDLDYRLEDQEGSVYAVGRSTQIYYDHEAGESRPIPSPVRAELEGLRDEPVEFRT